ncbi:uncharacterized protein [Blastocystis hominis]|uniref:Sugar phosphate transporter domain-containing protein n=1 Tax=Blastocystis hominis TaxID=12968 RepID=D8M3Y7_BLAHO|nr:uncharacterized protein [Blastocystis hominis]CBK22610.2 unnamed protein product [Blastocystis hominis]|eukprot:XP_012896658.1 uncharacterized protein [Blastocystis hominis]
MLMHMGMDRNYVHLCNGLLSCCILFPIVVFFEVRRSTYQMIRWDHVFISAFLQYLSSISSYSAMYLFSSLSYSIASTFKRVSIIVATSIILGNVLSWKNMLGIVVATAGAVGYNVVNRRSRTKRRLPPLEADRDLVYQKVWFVC